MAATGTGTYSDIPANVSHNAEASPVETSSLVHTFWPPSVPAEAKTSAHFCVMLLPEGRGQKLTLSSAATARESRYCRPWLTALTADSSAGRALTMRSRSSTVQSERGMLLASPSLCPLLT